jgi:hypothetical protein
VAPAAVQYTGVGIRIDATTRVKARARDAGVWSALTEATFLVEVDPPAAGNLVVSEIHYHPGAPSPDEAAAGYGDRDLFEFIELTNIGERSVDLGGVRFARGVRFEFREGTLLGPGGRIVLVSDRGAFTFRYPGVPVAGRYVGALANDGERLLLVDRSDDAVLDFAYEDGGGWPGQADGGGLSLELASESPSPAYGEAESWRPSATTGGTPGEPGGGRGGIPGDPGADLDSDGQPALMEYAFGTSDADPGESGAFEVDVDRRTSAIAFGFASDQGADGITFVIETSRDLADWSRADVDPLLPEPLPDGRVWRRYSYAGNVAEEGHVFFRLRVVLENP